MDKMLIQQGDILFVMVDAMPENVTEKSGSRPGLVTFAEGESTGHHHSCRADDVTLYEDRNGTLWCRVKKEVDVTHQEHGPVHLPAGEYRIGIVREVDPFSKKARPVYD